MTQSFKVEKGVEIPPKNSVHGPLVTAVRGMEVGDSIFVETKKRAASVVSTMGREGFGHTQRMIEGGYRVWRIK